MSVNHISCILMLWTWAYRVLALTLIKILYVLKKCLFIKNSWSHCTSEHFYNTRQNFIMNDQQQQQQQQQQQEQEQQQQPLPQKQYNQRKQKQEQQQQQQQQLETSYKQIPKVKGLPIFGTFFDIMAAGSYPQLHNYIDRRHQQYGKIFEECLGGGGSNNKNQNVIFISSANLMRSVFLHEGQHPKHPVPEAWILYNKKYNCQRGLFFMEGEEWYHNRRILNRCLLNGNLDWMKVHVQRCTEEFVKQLHNIVETQGNGAYEIDHMEQRLYRWSIDVIVSIIFGTSFSDNVRIRNALDDFSNVVHKIFENSAALMNFPAKLAQMFNLKIWRDFETCVSDVLKMGQDIIDMCMTLLDDKQYHVTDDYDCSGLYDKLRKADVPLDAIKRMFVDLAIAAGDTTAFSSAWALYLLSQSEELQENLFSESTQLNSTKDGVLIRGLIKETLRLYPAAPFIGRYLPKDVTIDGYQFKKDTLMLLSLYTAGRDANHFPEPLKVMPERWIRNEITDQYHAVHQPHATLPFAIGNRSCIGRKVALNQMEYLITEVSKKFHIKCTNAIIPVKPILRLVTVPENPLKLLFTLRNHL